MPASSFFRPRTDYFELNQAHPGDAVNGFADRVAAADFPQTKLRFWNDRWAQRVGLGELSAAEKIEAFACFRPLAGMQPAPLAMRYHGHQFRHYNANLGDGRGFLFAQCEDSVDHRLLDFGTKGSGQTPWSRAGDGRLTLKGAVREALATEMLEALGVNTSKTFSFFETGELLQRNDEPSPTRSAVLTRLSHGHIRYGTFQRLAVTGQIELMRELVDYSIRVYFPDLVDVESSDRAFGFLERVLEGAADLAASWMMSGFVHGVLNTDNMNITGESFDYGPWRFLPFYDPAFTAAYFDHEGLYSYSRQPEAVYWNLDQLARSLFAMAPEGSESPWQTRFVSILEKFPTVFQACLLRRFYVRLGLSQPADVVVAEEFFVSAFGAMGESKVGFEKFLMDFFGGRRGENTGSSYQTPKCADFLHRLGRMLGSGELRPLPSSLKILNSDYYLNGVPESLLIDEVEAIWAAIEKSDDWSLFESKIAALRVRGRLHGYGI
jgi:serine/tyrosine/threonine adenylyltransferase